MKKINLTFLAAIVLVVLPWLPNAKASSMNFYSRIGYGSSLPFLALSNEFSFMGEARYPYEAVNVSSGPTYDTEFIFHGPDHGLQWLYNMTGYGDFGFISGSLEGRGPESSSGSKAFLVENLIIHHSEPYAALKPSPQDVVISLDYYYVIHLDQSGGNDFDQAIWNAWIESRSGRQQLFSKILDQPTGELTINGMGRIYIELDSSAFHWQFIDGIWIGDTILDIGLYMTQTNYIPIPGSLFLFASGICGLAGVGLMKKIQAT